MTVRLVLSDGPHRMKNRCLEFRGVSRWIRDIVVETVMNSYMNHEDYWMKDHVGPFVQCDTYERSSASDDSDSYLLIECWSDNTDAIERYVRYLEWKIENEGIRNYTNAIK